MSTDLGVRRFVNQLTGWSVLPGNSNVARPSGQFATVLLTSSRVEGTPLEQEGTTEKLAETALDYSVQFHGDGAMDTAELFRDRADSGQFSLVRGLVYQGTSDITRLDETLSGEFHERAILTLMVRRIRGITINIDTAEAASIELNVNGEVTDI